MKLTSKFRLFLKKLGPGFITGASDNDPSGIAAYSQTGVTFGYNQLWTAFFTLPFMTIVQEMCGRIGLVTGKGLAGVIKKHYSKKILYFSVLILAFANTVNIGADLGSMAASAELLIGLPFIVWLVLITLVCIALQVFVPYKVYVEFLKYLTLTLFAYIIIAFIININWPTVFQSIISPKVEFNESYILNIVAILGTTISPYLFFWQAGEEVEEEIGKGQLKTMGHGKPQITTGDIRSMRMDTVIGMFFSNIVMFFIILTSASTLSGTGITEIKTATDAANALRPLAGDFAYLLFAIGIIGTGLLAVPVLAGSAAYAIAETFNLKEGLYRNFSQAHGFYAIIAVATLGGLVINFLGIPPFTLLYYTAILNGVCAPPLLFLIMRIANNKKIMGEYKNTWPSNLLGWTITFIMTGCALLLIWTLLR
jgi:NRAMP (natural resistance-associated macrophage protein)-like metal ion transporter